MCGASPEAVCPCEEGWAEAVTSRAGLLGGGPLLQEDYRYSDRERPSAPLSFGMTRLGLFTLSLAAAQRKR